MLVYADSKKMDNNINSTSGFFNNASNNSSACPPITQETMVTILKAIDWTLALPTLSWALWLLLRGFRLTLETEFFMFNLLCVDMLYTIVSMVMLFNDLFFHNDIFHYFALFVIYFSLYGHPYFQCCMCIERYLAVVHPVTFLKFRHVRYKVAALMLVWPVNLVFSFAEYFNNGPYALLSYLILVASIELFCSLSILRVLKNTGPGDELQKKERERSNATKKKAFAIVLMFQIKQLVNHMPFVIITVISGAFSLASYDCYLYFLGIGLCLFGTFIESCHYLQRTGRLSFIPGL